MTNTALAYPSSNGGWINRPYATGVCFGLVMLATTLASGSTGGTGADVSFSPRQQGNSLKIYATSNEKHSADVHRSPSENLTLIKTVLKPAVSELASSLGVSRQAIYNWLNGETISQVNATNKLKDLAKAAEVLDQAGVTINATLHKRKFAQGKTLMQVVESGGSAHDAALLLVDIHRRETAQREQMEARFAKRVKTSATADFDLPAAGEQSEVRA